MLGTEGRSLRGCPLKSQVMDGVGTPPAIQERPTLDPTAWLPETGPDVMMGGRREAAKRLRIRNYRALNVISSVFFFASHDLTKWNYLSSTYYLFHN